MSEQQGPEQQRSQPQTIKRVLVHGRVQGVGFRFATRAQAERLGVSGWVRNRADGSVEAELRGDAEQIAQMLDWLGRGPAGATVASLTVSDGQSRRPGFLPSSRDFRIVQ